MSRLAFALAPGALAAVLSLPAFAAQVHTNHLGIPIAPNAGNKSLHQWGGVDDAFAVNPDAGETSVTPQKGRMPDTMAQNQDDQDQDGDDDPDTDHTDEVLAI